MGSTHIYKDNLIQRFIPQILFLFIICVYNVMNLFVLKISFKELTCAASIKDHVIIDDTWEKYNIKWICIKQLVRSSLNVLSFIGPNYTIL